MYLWLTHLLSFASLFIKLSLRWKPPINQRICPKRTSNQTLRCGINYTLELLHNAIDNGIVLKYRFLLQSSILHGQVSIVIVIIITMNTNINSSLYHHQNKTSIPFHDMYHYVTNPTFWINGPLMYSLVINDSEAWVLHNIHVIPIGIAMADSEMFFFLINIFLNE